MSNQEVVYPSSFDQLKSDSSNKHGFNVEDSKDVLNNMPDIEIKEFLQEMIAEVDTVEDIADIDNKETLNRTLFSLLCNFSCINEENKALSSQLLLRTVDKIRRAITEGNIVSITNKNVCKKYIYYFSIFCTNVEQSFKTSNNRPESTTTGRAPKAAKSSKSSAATTTYNFLASLPNYLHSMQSLLTASNLSKLWSMGLVSEVILGQFCTFALKALEDKYIANFHLPIDIISKSVAFFPDPASTSSGAYAALSAILLDSILRAKRPEHTSGYIAEICAKPGVTFLVRELLSDISSQDLMGNQSNGSGSSATTGKADSSMLERTKNIATFIEVLAKVCPQTVYQHIPILMPLLESVQAHHIRSAMMNAMGQLVIHTYKTISTATDSILPVEPSDSEASHPFPGEDLANLTSVREALLDILMERAHDVSPFTRSAVLKTWREMLEAGAIPVEKVGTVAAIAVDRIHDRIALVRKNAASLLTVVLEQNPFAGTLNDVATFTTQKEDAEKLLRVRLDELKVLIKSLTAAEGEAMSTGEENEGSSAPTSNDSEDDLESNPAVIEDKVIVDCKYKISFSSSALQLLQSVAASLPRIKDMLRSETLSDVIEAIRFLSKAVRFDIAGASDAFSNALSLVWHQEKNIQKAIFNAFCSVYICDCDLSLPDVSDEQSSSSSSSSSVLSTSQSQSQSSFSSFPLAVLPGPQSMFSSDIIALNLIKLVHSCSSSGGEMVSLEKIIGSVLSDSALNKSIVQTLWTTVSNGGALAVRRAGHSLKKRDVLASSLRILSMVLQNEKGAPSTGEKLQASQIVLLTKVVFDEESFAANDFASMKSALLCLQSLPTYLEKVHSSRSYTNTSLYAAIQDLFPLLVKAICGHFVDDRDETMTSKWFSLCEEAVHALFHLHPTPDKVMSTTVNFMFVRLLHSQQQQQQLDSSSSDRMKCSSAELSRFLFVLGQTALNSLVYIEHIAGYAKKAAIHAATNPTTNLNVSTMNSTMLDNVSMNSSITLPTPLNTPRPNESLSSSSSSSSFVGGEKAVNAMEEEMDTAAAVDAEQERILFDAVENDLCLRNILGKFLPIVSFIVANQSGTYSDSTLRLTSVLTLCRFMSTSSVICEASLPLLFTTLEREVSVHVRSTIVIALGDLAFRFPNSVEPWTDRIYMRLSDTSPAVRYNTLMVITHLVLNDMLKVKGQVSQVVLSLNDSCTEVRDLAHVFFKKLADRSNNPVYNLLGDIIGVFSQDESATTAIAATTTSITTSLVGGNSTAKQLTEEEFKETMHFMLSFVKKDKQADNLLERLMLRMGSASSLRQRRYLAFCISELSVTEKGLKKMIELIKNVKEALYDEAVFKYFETALSKAKKSNRSASKAGADGAEVKTTMEELEALLAGIRKLVVHGAEEVMEEDCDENELPASGEQQPSTTTTSDRQTRAPSSRKPPLSNGKKNTSTTAAKKGAKGGSGKAAATKSKRSKKAIAYSEDEDEMEDDIDDDAEELGIAARDDDAIDEDDEEPVVAKASKLPPKGRGKASKLPPHTSTHGKQNKNDMARALMEL